LEFKSKNILILGGNSDVAKCLALDFARLGSNLILTERKNGQLAKFSNDLESNFDITCKIKFLDIIDFKSHNDFFNETKENISIVVSCIGFLDEQKKSEIDFKQCLNSIQTNYTGLVSILNLYANHFENNNFGTIVGLSSVAGERGRVTNYIYGSAKAGFTVYLSGLRNRLFKKGVNVITIIPGFIMTKMTAHLPLNKFLTVNPADVSLVIINSIKRNKDIVYVHTLWRFIMIIIRNIPEFFFKKTHL
jgi:short-subunit dehydrogenase